MPSRQRTAIPFLISVSLVSPCKLSRSTNSSPCACHPANPGKANEFGIHSFAMSELDNHRHYINPFDQEDAPRSTTVIKIPLRWSFYKKPTEEELGERALKDMEERKAIKAPANPLHVHIKSAYLWPEGGCHLSPVFELTKDEECHEMRIRVTPWDRRIAPHFPFKST